MSGTLILAGAGKKLISSVTRKFGKKVIERWTRYRAAKFFEGFIESLSEELITGHESSQTDSVLEAILDDEVKSEVLYDSYRKVCFAKSKKLGPKIIGILTGYLVAEGRVADGVEDQVFAAAEALSDEDLLDLFKQFRKWAKRADAGKDPKRNPHWEGDSIVIPWNEETRDTASPHSMEVEIDVSPLNFADVFDGQWGMRAENLGLLSGRITQRQIEYREDGERHIDEDGVLTIYARTVTFEAPCRKLCDLIERSLGGSQADLKLYT